MKRVFFTLLLLITIFAATAQTPMRVHDSKLDWSDVTEKIVRGKTSKHDQAHAIYRWVCDNIDYDTSFLIYDADQAFAKKRGVCQAYCELFYRLAEPAGIKVEIIPGKSKDRFGKISEMGHSWLLVTIDDGRKIFIDPTWGAGTVEKHRFIRKANDDSWFDVDPRWMIFTHLPDEEAYQHLDKVLDYDTFRKLKPLNPDLSYLGYDPAELLRKSLAGEEPSIPPYSSAKGLRVKTMPRQLTLQVGEYYDFVVKRHHDYDFAVINEKDYSLNWTFADDTQSLTFMPSLGGTLTLGYRKKGTEGPWDTLVQYDVAQPTSANIAILEEHFPEKSPLLKSLPNYNPDILRAKGVNFAALLAEVKRDEVLMLPNISSEGDFKLNSVPMNGRLKPGKKYTFTFSPADKDGDWVIVNGEEWIREWTKDNSTNTWTLPVKAASKGKLRLAYKPKFSAGNNYSVFIEYNISK